MVDHYRMSKYTSLKTRMDRCKQRIQEQTKNQKTKIIMLKKKMSSNLPPEEFDEIERQKEFKEQEEKLKNSIKSLV